MSAYDLQDLVSSVYDESSHWSPDTAAQLAGRSIPDKAFGSKAEAIKGDGVRLWARWFLEGMLDLDRVGATWATLYSAASDGVRQLMPQVPADERRALSRSLANAARLECRRRLAASRGPIPRNARLDLLTRQGSQPRCWICGYAFQESAIRGFAQSTHDPTPDLPLYVDYWAPRGLVVRDLRIEVDHVFPASTGGDESPDNLRLSCGWCNRYKSNRLTLYDAPSSTTSVPHPTLGTVSAPQPFWVVRLLALRRRCEDASGCAATVDNAQLFLAPRFPRGSANPTNAWVCCRDHDPIRADRFVPRPKMS